MAFYREKKNQHKISFITFVIISAIANYFPFLDEVQSVHGTQSMTLTIMMTIDGWRYSHWITWLLKYIDLIERLQTHFFWYIAPFVEICIQSNLSLFTSTLCTLYFSLVIIIISKLHIRTGSTGPNYQYVYVFLWQALYWHQIDMAAVVPNT